ncbi:MAG: hypothetical protein R3281_13130, partial [Balneolaceae bacterium]|nr:hypothetical protein [Balneolaceae bacterium]
TEHPVVKVFDEETGEMVYVLRSHKPAFRPFVFEEGSYRVEVGNPETGQWQTHAGLTPSQ